jgi:DNA ligase-1
MHLSGRKALRKSFSSNLRAGQTNHSCSIRVPYSALTDCFDQIDQTTKRLLISNYLTQFLLKVAMNPGQNGEDLKRVVYLCINRVGC